jgi:succinate-acetate transporter protein
MLPIKHKILQDNDGNESSKRTAGYIFGALGILMGIIIFTVSLFHGVADSSTALSVMYAFLGICGGLLGITVFEKFGHKK